MSARPSVLLIVAHLGIKRPVSSDSATVTLTRSPSTAKLQIQRGVPEYQLPDGFRGFVTKLPHGLRNWHRPHRDLCALIWGQSEVAVASFVNDRWRHPTQVSQPVFFSSCKSTYDRHFHYYPVFHCTPFVLIPTKEKHIIFKKLNILGKVYISAMWQA